MFIQRRGMIRLALPLLRAVMCDTGASVAGLLVAQTRPFSILSRAHSLLHTGELGDLIGSCWGPPAHKSSSWASVPLLLGSTWSWCLVCPSAKQTCLLSWRKMVQRVILRCPDLSFEEGLPGTLPQFLSASLDMLTSELPS